MRFAGPGVGGTDEACGRGSCKAGLGRALSVGGSGCGVECRGVSVIRYISGGSSMEIVVGESYSRSERAFWRLWWNCLVLHVAAHHVEE